MEDLDKDNFDEHDEQVEQQEPTAKRKQFRWHHKWDELLITCAMDGCTLVRATEILADVMRSDPQGQASKAKVRSRVNRLRSVLRARGRTLPPFARAKKPGGIDESRICEKFDDYSEDQVD